jgi:plasmid rolling circle replication initiator protein Rep
MFVVISNVNVESVNCHAKGLFYPTFTQNRINVSFVPKETANKHWQISVKTKYKVRLEQKMSK